MATTVFLFLSVFSTSITGIILRSVPPVEPRVREVRDQGVEEEDRRVDEDQRKRGRLVLCVQYIRTESSESGW